MPNLSASKPTLQRLVPHEIAQRLSQAVALVAVVASGVLISAALPHGASIWFVASSYMAPASIAFVAHWWMSQRD